MELVCFLLNGIVYAWFMCKLLKLNLFQFSKDIILPAVLPVIILAITLIFVRNYLPLEKSKLNLIFVAITGIAATALATGIYYFTSQSFRNYTINLILKFKQFINSALANKSKLII